jgi:hypothetical protein
MARWHSGAAKQALRLAEKVKNAYNRLESEIE